MNFFSKILKKLGIHKGFASVAAGNAFAAIGMSVFWFILAILMTTEDYGQLTYYLSLAHLFGAFSYLGMRHAVITLLAKGDEKILNEANLFVLLTSIIISILLFTFIDNVPTVLLLVCLNFFLMSRAEDLGRQNYKKYSLVTITNRSLHIGLSLSLFFVMGVDGVILGNAISTAVFSYNFFRSFKKLDFKFTQLRKKFSFTVHIFSLNISRIIAIHVDKLLIAHLFGLSLLGEFQLAFQVLLLLSIIPQSTIQFLLPREAARIRDSKIEKKVLILAISFSLLLFFSIPFLIPALLPNFEKSVEGAQIMCFGVIPMTIIAIINSRLIGREKTKMVVVGAAIRLASLVILIFLLGESMGLAGLALAVVISIILHSASLSFFYKFRV